MKRRYLCLPAVLAAILLLASMAPREVAAAIPCIEQETIHTSLTIDESDVDPKSIEDVFAGPEWEQDENGATTGQATPGATPQTSTESVVGPVENIVRCLTYGDFEMFATLVTGDYRGLHIGVTSPQRVESIIEDSPSVVLLKTEDTRQVDHGVASIDVELLLYGSRVLGMTLEFEEIDGEWYLNDSNVRFAKDVGSQVVLEINEGGISPDSIEIESGDVTMVGVDNTLETNFEYQLDRIDNGATSRIHAGRVYGEGMVGPPDNSTMVLHDLEPGTYQLTLEPEESDAGETQVVDIEVLPAGDADA